MGPGYHALIDSLRIIAFLMLLILPGALVTYPLVAGRLNFWTKCALSHALSWPIAAGLYLLIRAFGIDHELAWLMVVAGSLPALFFVAQAYRKSSISLAETDFVLVLAIALPSVALGLVLLLGEATPFWSHALMHANTVLALVESPFSPENRLLAGKSMTYPWLPHVYYLLLSSALDVPPSFLIYLTGPTQLLAFSTVSVAIVARLGGERVALLLAPVVCSTATNPIGSVMRYFLASDGTTPVSSWYYRSGDPRYGLTLRKFFLFSTNSLGELIVACLALILILLMTARTMRLQVFVLLLTFVLPILYPLYLPVSLMLIGAYAAFAIVFLPAGERKASIAILFLAIVLSLCAYEIVGLQTSDRVTGTGVSIVFPPDNLIAVGIAMSLPVAGFLFVARSVWKTAPGPTVLLALAGFGSIALATMLSIPHFANEYKFVLSAAVLLAPFLVLFLEACWTRGGLYRTAIFGFMLVASAAFATESLKNFYMGWSGNLPDPQRTGMTWTVSDAHTTAPLLTAVRDSTPRDTIFVMDQDLGFDIPTFAERSIYFRTGQSSHFGVAMEPGHMVADVLGYGEAIVTERRSTLSALFEGSERDRRMAIERISELERPIGIIVSNPANRDLLDWLSDEGIGRPIHIGAETLWLIDPI